MLGIINIMGQEKTNIAVSCILEKLLVTLFLNLNVENLLERLLVLYELLFRIFSLNDMQPLDAPSIVTKISK